MYMNSALQILLHTPTFKDFFLNHLENIKMLDKRESFSLTYEFGKVLDNIWSGSNSSFSPREFKYKAQRFIEILKGYNQEDSFECLSGIIVQIHNEFTNLLPTSKKLL